MIEELKTEILKRKASHSKGQKMWSLTHHATTFGASILSLIVVTLSQTADWSPKTMSRDTAIAFCSLGAAILAALAAKGGFEKKWATNRMTRSKLDSLQLDTLDDEVDAEKVKERLQRIIIEHDAKITGTDS